MGLLQSCHLVAPPCAPSEGQGQDVALDPFPNMLSAGEARPLPCKAPRGLRTSRNPKHALSVHFVSTGFLKDVQAAGYSRRSCIHEIEESVLRGKGKHMRCPRDELMGCAYVDTVTGEDNVALATHMLSYSWGYQVGDIADTLSAYCQDHGLDPKRTYVWICCMCINQHRVKDAERRGEVVSFEVFKETFGQQVGQVDHILAMMAPWHNPKYVHRVWCVYEFSTAMALGKSVTVVMPFREQEAFRKALMAGKLHSVFDALSAIRIQDAGASVADDKANILKAIDPNSQDYDTSPVVAALNSKVREKLQGWFVQTAAVHLEQHLSKGGHVDLETICAACRLLIIGSSSYDRAIALLEAGIACNEGKGTSYASARTLLGWCHHFLGNVILALQCYADAKAAYNAAGVAQGSDYAMLLQCISVDYIEQGYIDAALRHSVEAKTIYEAAAAAKGPDYARCLQNTGLALRGRDNEAAMCYYMEAEAIHKAAGTIKMPNYAQLLQFIGMAHFDKGDMEAAQCYCAEAKVVFEEAGHTNVSTPYAQVLQSIGTIQHDQGDIGTALRTYMEAAAVYQAAGAIKRPTYARLLQGIGMAHCHQDNMKLALSYCAQAKTIFEDAGACESADYANVLQTIGLVRCCEGDIKAALRHFADAKAIFEASSVTKSPNYAQVLQNIGTVHFDQGDIKTALRHFAEARAAYEAAGATKSLKYTQLLQRFQKLSL